MKKQIEEFVQGLLDSTLTDEQQSVLLHSEIKKTGGSNNSQCVNKSTSCQGTNDICINYDHWCDYSTNTGICLPKKQLFYQIQEIVFVNLE